jgi:hypothetical protein
MAIEKTHIPPNSTQCNEEFYQLRRFKIPIFRRQKERKLPLALKCAKEIAYSNRSASLPTLRRKLVVPMAIEKTPLPRNSTHAAHLVVVYPNGETEQFEGNAIVNRNPYGDRLLTVAGFISE